jgi:hypothetical protein
MQVKSVEVSSKRTRADKKSVEHNLPPDMSNHEAQRLNAGKRTDKSFAVAYALLQRADS